MKLEDEKGFVMVLAIMLLLVLTLLGMSAISTTSYDNQIAGNKRVSDQAFYVAEAGLQELLGRFRPGATGEVSDGAPSNPNWRLFMALDTGRAAAIGYDSGNSNHSFVQSLQPRLDFALEVRHKVNIANAVLTKAGFPIYVVRSHGFAPEGGRKVIETELYRCPSLDPHAALYSEQPVNVHGSSTYIQGMDACGTNNNPGIAVTLPI